MKQIKFASHYITDLQDMLFFAQTKDFPFSVANWYEAQSKDPECQSIFSNPDSSTTLSVLPFGDVSLVVHTGTLTPFCPAKLRQIVLDWVHVHFSPK